MYKLQDLNKLPEDIVRYIFLFDNTYHEHFRIVLKELKHVTRLLRIVLETRFSSHKSINGIILFEHHYDLMILKDYTFRNINNLLIKNNFKQVYKSKMILRKSFEYIYINKKYKFD